MGFRNRKQKPFTQIVNDALRDPRTSLKAKGLLALMLTFPDDWDYHMSHLYQYAPDGKDSFASAFASLERHGYAMREQTRKGGGQFADVDYFITDEPEPIVTSTANGFSGSGKSATTNTDYTNTNSKDASASRVASQPLTVSSDESPEGRVQGADNLPLSGPLPADHETVGTDIKKPIPPAPLPITPSGSDFADESLSHFPSGTSAHPEPQTPLPDPPTSSTGHSLLDRMAQLQASGKEDTEAMKRAKQRKDKANRQHWAIRGSIENASEQAIFDMVGEQGYRYMLRLMKDIRTSADSILGWLKRRPALATVIGKLTDETYVVHLQAGIDKAKRHTSGWQASPLPWFFEAVLSEVPEEKRTATPNGNSRHEYKVRMDAAQTAQEVRSIIEEFKTRGQLETRMKRDEQRNLVRDKDGEPVYNSAEEEIMLVCEERGLSLTKGEE